jgi:hypothetical protein
MIDITLRFWSFLQKSPKDNLSLCHACPSIRMSWCKNPYQSGLQKVGDAGLIKAGEKH